MRNNLRSCPLRATSISPTGNPPARGSGNEMAQRSKKLTIVGLRKEVKGYRFNVVTFPILYDVSLEK